MSGRPFERHLNKQVLIEGPENPSVNSEIFGSAIEDNVSGVKSPAAPSSTAGHALLWGLLRLR